MNNGTAISWKKEKPNTDKKYTPHEPAMAEPIKDAPGKTPAEVDQKEIGNEVNKLDKPTLDNSVSGNTEESKKGPEGASIDKGNSITDELIPTVITDGPKELPNNTAPVLNKAAGKLALLSTLLTLLEKTGSAKELVLIKLLGSNPLNGKEKELNKPTDADKANGKLKTVLDNELEVEKT